MLLLLLASLFSGSFGVDIWLSSSASQTYNAGNPGLCTQANVCKYQFSTPIMISTNAVVHIAVCGGPLNLQASGELRVVFEQACQPSTSLGTIIGTVVTLENLHFDYLTDMTLTASTLVWKNVTIVSGPWYAPIGTIGSWIIEESKFMQGFVAIANTTSVIGSIEFKNTFINGTFVIDSYTEETRISSIKVDNSSCHHSKCLLEFQAYEIALQSVHFEGYEFLGVHYNLLCFNSCTIKDSIIHPANNTPFIMNDGLPSLAVFDIERSSFKNVRFQAFNYYTKPIETLGTPYFLDIGVTNARIIDSEFLNSPVAIRARESICISNSHFSSFNDYRPLIVSGPLATFEGNNTFEDASASTKCSLCFLDDIGTVNGTLNLPSASIGIIPRNSSHANNVGLKGQVSAKHWIGCPPGFEGNTSVVAVAGPGAMLTLSDSYDGHCQVTQVYESGVLALLWDAQNPTALNVSQETLSNSIVVSSTGLIAFSDNQQPQHFEKFAIGNSEAFNVRQFLDKETFTVEYGAFPNEFKMRFLPPSCRIATGSECHCIAPPHPQLTCSGTQYWTAQDLNLVSFDSIEVPPLYTLEVQKNVTNYGGSITLQDESILIVNGAFVNEGELSVFSSLAAETGPITSGAIKKSDETNAGASHESRGSPQTFLSPIYEGCSTTAAHVIAGDLKLTKDSTVRVTVDLRSATPGPKTMPKCITPPLTYSRTAEIGGKIIITVIVDEGTKVSPVSFDVIGPAEGASTANATVSNDLVVSTNLMIGSALIGQSPSCSEVKSRPGLVSLVVQACDEPTPDGKKRKPLPWYYWAVPVIVVAILAVVIAAVILSVSKLRHKFTPWRNARM